MSMNDQKIYQAAIDKWGERSQFGMLIEECAELISAINRWQRGNTDPVPVMEEIADVDIMLEQMKIIFDSETYAGTIESIKSQKLARLKIQTQPEQ